MNKVYMIVQTNNGNSIGEYVNIMGIYNNKEEANIRLESLNEKINDRGFLKNSDSQTRYLYECKEVEMGKDIDLYLGGYSK